MAQIVALGDCNTRGTDSIGGNAYPEQLGVLLGKSVRNCGVTMSTTREMIRLYPEWYLEATHINEEGHRVIAETIASRYEKFAVGEHP